MANCFNCEFAERDRHNRFIDRCSGYGNCGYQEFNGNIKPNFYEATRNIYNSINEDNMYSIGFKDALKILYKWMQEEDGIDIGEIE